MEKAVKPEEPLFYIGLLIVLIYFIYLYFLDTKQKRNSAKKIESLENKILKAKQNYLSNNQLLKDELTKYYPVDWVESAFNGQIYKGMPIILLKVALGTPKDIVFNGSQGQVWKYDSKQEYKLLINIWDEQITTWQQIN
ncbi:MULTISPECIES: hypothetical protein [Myroides]|uniref:Uncharacterized protein n=1 Tax=Myroides albus TaxID=2562892 RepID=A0A6I3LLP8_9FLAO|nr:MULTISPECIES: hypothetical protein [Myroides]MTG98210.1 hypothetical protein [Myroides albus]MVX36352.1 hypothetical protein [Myroides sp. LoEW2-1]UVD79326.1 hypothetical protein NWE55_14510 [Myroides albus]